MTNFTSLEEFEANNPLARYSFYANGRMQLLESIATEILAELDRAFADDVVLHQHLARAEALSWLWLLGSYEVVRTMCQAKKCFSERAGQALQELKRLLGRVRMPAAKMEKSGKREPVTSNRSAAGVSAPTRDLLLGDPNAPESLRHLLERFSYVFAQIKASDVLDSHEASY